MRWADPRDEATMPEPRPLRRPPIREAVIDIQVPAVDSETGLDPLRALARDMGYSGVQEAFEFGAGFRVGRDGGFRQNHEVRAVGFRAISEAEGRVVEFRLNGIGVGQLEPYQSWRELRALTSSVWARFRDQVHPPHATRLAVRYVNHIRLPYPSNDLDRYFRGLPQNPEEWPAITSSFLFRRTLHDEAHGAVVNVTHALADDVDEDRIGVIFDIDAYMDGQFDVDDEAIWGPLTHLRELKNRVFFAGVTESTLKHFD
jgi:uncharacterized protein (TIGR04255 family)